MAGKEVIDPRGVLKAEEESLREVKVVVAEEKA